MYKLKEFYQYQRELKKENKTFRSLILPKFKHRTCLANKVKFLKPFDNRFVDGAIFLKASQNNTIITLTNIKGRVKFVRSCGYLGFQGKKKRSTKFAIESTLFSIVQKVKELRWTKLALYLSGFAKGRFFVLNTLKKNNLKISFVKDITPIPHNGCRLKKLRRG